MVKVKALGFIVCYKLGSASTSQRTSHSSFPARPVPACAFLRLWGPHNRVQPVRHSIVNHTTFVIYGYGQVSLLHLGGARQWFTGESAQVLHYMS